MEIRRIETPLEESLIDTLRAGDKVLLNGFVFTARDAAHKRFIEAIREGRGLPFDVRGQVIYYCGPSPARPGRIIGSCGPTTSSRMDGYAPTLVGMGLKGMIGKGKRTEEVREAMRRHKAVYFGATGGAGALLSRTVVSAEIVAYAELGPEAVMKLGVRDMPVFVVDDIYGNDLYERGTAQYQR